MGRYVLRRLLQMIPVVIGTTFLIYWLVWSLPGDPFAGRCGDRPCDPSYIASIRSEYNLDDPLFVQYGKYMWKLLHGDFGLTFGGSSVRDILAETLPTTARLALVALLFEAVVGIGAGVITGLRRNGFLDNVVLISTLLFVALPIFVTGYALQYVFSIKWNILSPSVSSDAPWNELLLPGFVLGSISMAYVARLTRSSIAENNRSDYVRTAAAKGLTRRRIIGVHVLRNSLIPLITFLGSDLGFLMGGAIVTEGIFNINGIGGQIFQAVQQHQAGTVVPIVTVLVLVFLFINLIVDVLYGILDPRIRYE